MINKRQELKSHRRWVIKIGSALLTADGKGLDLKAMAGWVEQVVALNNRGMDIVLVSSGSVAEGMTRLGWQQRPEAIHELQAAAAVGQMGLVQAWESCFQKHGKRTAQVLLVHDDLSNRKRYLNARSTLATLLELGVMPVINENDTVVTDEIRFGDNDTLAALVTNLIEAEALVILTDQDGLFEQDPRANPQAKLISVEKAGHPELDTIAGGSAGALGRGGMITKIRAARLAARSGSHTLIAGGRCKNILLQLASGADIGTLLVAEQKPQAARKQWLAGHLQTRGSLVLDAGAVKVLKESGKSLLPIGVTAVSGNFTRGEMVVCLSSEGEEIARGLINYNAEEAGRILGKPTRVIAQVLGYVGEDEMIHRDNLVLSKV